MPKSHSYYVYILLCADSTYYTGVTNNITLRVKQHELAKDPASYTAQRLPIKLVWAQQFKYINDAIAWEKRIKRWSKAKKEALINSEYEKLPLLAKKKFS